MNQVVIVGTGQAGGWVARSLRDNGFTGEIVIIGDEAHPPYERPPLSKALLLGQALPESTHLFKPAAWRELNVTWHSTTRVERIDRDQRRLHLANGASVSYETLVLATGSRVRLLDVPGAGLPGIHALRTLDDSAALAETLGRGGQLLVVGAGWIGLEVAAAARQRGLGVTVIDKATALCSRALPPDLSPFMAALHQSHGVEFRLDCTVSAFTGTGRVERAALSDGTELAIDAVLIGIGIIPNTELAGAAGLAVQDGIVVNAAGRTADPAIYAAGEVTRHPNAWLGHSVRLESWATAQNHGIHVGRSLMGRIEQPYGEAPWFWSDQYDMNLQMFGELDNAGMTVDRALGGDAFIRFYLRDGRAVGGFAANGGRDVRFARQLVQARRSAEPASLADPTVKLQDLARPSA